MTSRTRSSVILSALAALAAATPESAQTNTPGTVLTETRIGSDLLPLGPSDRFGAAVAVLGDLNGDGTKDVAVGAPKDDDGASGAGAVYILFLDGNRDVADVQKISSLEGAFPIDLPANADFGQGLAAAGDVNDDGVPDLAVGAPGLNDGEGGVFVLLLAPDGTVTSFTEISSTSGGLSASLDTNDGFGAAIAGIGDLDLDTVPDLVVGAYRDDDGGEGDPDSNAGAAYVLFLTPAGAVSSERKIGKVTNFPELIETGDKFGSAVAVLGDVDDDGITDIAVGAGGDDDLAANTGAVWVLFMEADGTVSGANKMIPTEELFPGTTGSDGFGAALAGIGDINGDQRPDVAIGVYRDIVGGITGAVWVVYLDAEGAPKGDPVKINSFEGNFEGDIAAGDQFGSALAFFGFLDVNSVDDGGFEAGPGSGEWMEMSDNFGSPICDADLCGGLGGGSGPHTGQYWAWFGGPNGFPETASLRQNGVRFESDVFTFHLENIRSSGNGFDMLTMKIGNTVVLEVIEGDEAYDSGYVPVTVDVSAFNDGSSRPVIFEVETSGSGTTNFFVDDLFLPAASDGAFDLYVGAPFDEEGAVWKLTMEGPFLAQHVDRNGTGVNPVVYQTMTEAVLGEDWQATVSVTGTDFTASAIIGMSEPLEPGVMIPLGEVLIDLFSEEVIASLANAGEMHENPVPNNLDLVGFKFYSQAVRYGGGEKPEFCNAIDYTLGAAE